MEKSSKIIIVLFLGIVSGGLLLVTSDNIDWLIFQIFAIFVSILFFSPLIQAVYNVKRPKEWILTFILGTFLFVVYSLFMFSTPIEVIHLVFTIILYSSLSSICLWVVDWLAHIIPPD